MIWGTDGHVSYLDGELRINEGDAPEYIAAVEQAEFDEVTKTKLSAFIEAVRTGGESPVPGEFGATVTALTEAAYEAAKTGRRVSVPRTNDRIPVEQ